MATIYYEKDADPDALEGRRSRSSASAARDTRTR